MEPSTVKTECLSMQPRDVLSDLLRRGAQQMLAAASENEVTEYLGCHAPVRDSAGHRLVVRNGYLPARKIQTGNSGDTILITSELHRGLGV